MRQVKGYEGLYLIDEYGNVTSVVRSKKKSILQNGDRYLKVGLTKNKVQKRVSVHRLVALTYIPNPDNKPQVNHKDGNTLNNHVSNLEWATAKENVQHSWNNGLSKVTDEQRKKMSDAKKGCTPWNKGKRQKPLRHGTMYAYNQGCRCDECKQCNTIYCRNKNNGVKPKFK